MKRLSDGIKDIGKAAVIGLGVGWAAASVLWLAGFLFSGFHMKEGWKAARAGLLIVGTMGLFLLAGSNLFHQGKLLELKDHKDEWKKHFRVMGLKTVLGCASVVVIALASVIDYFLYYG